MKELTRLVLVLAICECVHAQTITFRSLQDDSSSSSSSNSSIGPNSDISRQLYTRYKAGDSAAQVELNFVPTAVSKRLEPLNIVFQSLPGLVQRAVLWDTGFAMSPDNDAVQMWPMSNYSMADIAIPKADVANVDCSFLNCSQPNEVEAYYTQYCTGYQILNASRCVVDLFEDSGAGSFLGMMWSVGGDPNMVPELRLRDHTWTQDIEVFGGNITFSVYAVHTVSSENDPAWDVCPSGYASLTIPCHRRDQFSDEFMAANTTVPVGSAWVTNWLEEEFAQGSGFDKILLIPILLGIAFVAGVGWFYWRRRGKQKAERTLSTTADCDFNSTCHYWGGGTPDMVLRPMMVTSQLSSQLSTLSMQYESAGSNTTLQILLGSEYLQGKHLAYDSLVFEKAISKGASGEVWFCDYNGQKVAVKRLLQTKHQKAQHVQAFAEEIELSASLVHPHIVQFIGVAWNTLNNLVMVMEYLPMGNLQRYLKVNVSMLSWSKDKLYLALGIAQALEYLHGRSSPIIHRDLKSSNILLTNELKPKLIDFGVSRGKIDLTMTGGIGTPYWTAPEVLEGKRYSEQADIYSFGVVLSELDTGKPPYCDAVTEHGGMPKPFYILQDVMAGRLRPTFSQDCPLRIKSLGLACLALDVTRRPTAEKLVQTLLQQD
ncbi:putative serine/threonine-protein kinase/receptor [Phytophthora citrophthora]|uniref:Serine/threonine-protein kinase/receptor n=1 Tax=Phytophthora citrophthora TaxID=4793 RepID=A0AAD9GYB2_9STRA|nr:putative serine/threonine-protein kinase/receptor [Phytophthora citrophthora]